MDLLLGLLLCVVLLLTLIFKSNGNREKLTIDNDDLKPSVAGSIAKVPIKFKLMVNTPWPRGGGLQCMTDDGSFKKTDDSASNCTELILRMDSAGYSRIIHPKLGYLQETDQAWKPPQGHENGNDGGSVDSKTKKNNIQQYPYEDVFSTEFKDNTNSPADLMISAVDETCNYFKIITITGKAMTVFSRANRGLLYEGSLNLSGSIDAWEDSGKAPMVSMVETADEPVHRAQKFFAKITGSKDKDGRFAKWKTCTSK